MWLTRLARKYPISTFLFAVTILVLGLVSLSQLPIDLLPNISIPTVTVSTNYPGAGEHGKPGKKGSSCLSAIRQIRSMRSSRSPSSGKC